MPHATDVQLPERGTFMSSANGNRYFFDYPGGLCHNRLVDGIHSTADLIHRRRFNVVDGYIVSEIGSVAVNETIIPFNSLAEDFPLTGDYMRNNEGQYYSFERDNYGQTVNGMHTHIRTGRRFTFANSRIVNEVVQLTADVQQPQAELETETETEIPDEEQPTSELSVDAPMTRKFGIELEVEHSNEQQLARIIESTGVRCRYEGYTHAVLSSWKVVHDGSVRHGYEIVSPVLEGEAGIAEAKKVCLALEAANVKVNKSCGFHVHVDMTGTTYEAMRRLCLLWLKYEPLIEHILPKSRKSNTNQYCKSAISQFDSFADAVQELSTIRSHSELMGKFCDVDDRYYKLNPTVFTRQGTVEFRCAPGTTLASKMENWVRFCVSMVEYALNTNSAIITTDNLSSEQIAANPLAELEAMCDTLRVNASVKEYILSRGRNFATLESVCDKCRCPNCVCQTIPTSAVNAATTLEVAAVGQFPEINPSSDLRYAMLPSISSSRPNRFVY